MKHCKLFAALALTVATFMGSAGVASNRISAAFFSNVVTAARIPPMVTFITPSAVVAGGPGFSLTVNGTDFVAMSIVQWNGANRVTAFLSTTQLTAMISAEDVASGGTASVTVLNPIPNGGVSNGVTFTVNNPLPMVFGVTPGSVTAGGPSFALVVNGANFVPSSVVQWNGMNRATGFTDSTRLIATISASDVTDAGPASVSVISPGPGGGSSAAISFDVKAPENPLPSINSINPASATAGAGWINFTVNGGGFTSSSTIQWNGSNRNTNFISPTQLTAAIYPNDVASAGTAVITVYNPAPGGGTSNRQEFTVRPLATPPSATGTATPPSVKAGDTVLLVVKVVPGANPDSTGLMVSADLTSIGGSRTQQLYDDGAHGDVKPGDNIFSFRAAIGASTLIGKKSLPVAVVDAQGRKTTVTIQLSVGSALSSSGTSPR